MKIHILTRGFDSPNGIAFLFPLHVHRRRLADLGLTFRCFSRTEPELTDCDVLIVESRHYSPRWARNGSAVLDELGGLAARVGSLLWFDISDSTGWLQSQVLPVVARYFKSQLLRERTAYLQPHYGNRIYADYYYRTFGISDSDPVETRPVANSAHLDKLGVSWNSGLADYSLWGPSRMALRRHVPFDALLRFPTRFAPVRGSRSVAFASRFGFGHPRETIAYQRRRIRNIFGNRAGMEKLSRRAYLSEMRQARAVISPFGYGEITLKDFEAALCGALLVKPDMTHLETWPDLFRDGETMVAHRWDLSDIEDVLDGILADDARRVRIAEQAQDCYRRHIAEDAGYESFCIRFRDIVRTAK